MIRPARQARHGRTAAALTLLAGALHGCGEEPQVAPPQIAWGQDICHACGMIISDDRFAAGLVVAGVDGSLRTLAFDDIGCLLEYETGEAGRIAARYVRDFGAGQWRHAEAAAYLHSTELHSPMAFGLAALDTEADARALAGRYPGEVLDFTGVRARFESGNLVMRPD